MVSSDSRDNSLLMVAVRSGALEIFKAALQASEDELSIYQAKSESGSQCSEHISAAIFRRNAVHPLLSGNTRISVPSIRFGSTTEVTWCIAVAGANAAKVVACPLALPAECCARYREWRNRVWVGAKFVATPMAAMR